MSKPLPYFPFYVADFACDGKVEGMSTQAVGAYILLLCKAWQETPPGSIPDDDSVLAKWSRLSPDQWSECRPSVVAAFRRHTDGRFYQKRMVDEYRKLCRIKRLRSDAANVRWSQQSTSNASALQRVSDSESRKPEGGVEETDPPWLAEVLGSWVGYKSERGQRYKPKGMAAVKSEMLEHGEAWSRAAVQHSMACNYAGLFPPKGSTNGSIENSPARIAAKPGKYAHIGKPVGSGDLSPADARQGA